MEVKQYQVFQGLGTASGSAAVVYSVVNMQTGRTEGAFLTLGDVNRLAERLNTKSGSAGERASS